MKYRRYAWVAGVSAIFITATALSAIFIPSVHAQALWGYRYGRSVVLGEAMVEDVVASPSPTPEISVALQAQVQQLQEKVTALEYSNAQYRTVTNEIQDNVKTAIAEVAKTNDLLEKRQSEWLSTLSRLRSISQNPTVSDLAETAATSEAGNTSPSATAKPGKVNLNTATAAELDTLPGIGPTYAERIVAFRKEKGNFTSIDDLANVQGIGPATLEKIRPLVGI